MKFGINILARETSCDLREIGKRVEDAGFDSMFLPEHTHIPVDGDVHAGGPDVHERMKRLPDPYIALTAIASVTSRLRIGTGISLIAQHEPVAMAKRIATLDQSSGGRFMLGIGTGWNRSEAATHGVRARARWCVMREHVLAMKAIWTQDEAEFHGEFVDFGPMWSWPKPRQRPHPTVIVGGEGPGVLDRVLEYGDAWGPHPVPGVIQRIHELQQRAQSGGRSPVPVTLFNVPHDVEQIRGYASAGVERCVLYIYDDGPGTIAATLDEHAEFINRYWSLSELAD
jgi:probable F420-dependent oxidoreductase